MNPESMQGPILDSDGYPTDEAIRALENWEYPYHRIVEFLEIIFEGFGWCRQEGKLLKLSTGGWSGNEDAINALMSNYMFQAICWLKSERGGHYEFELPEDSRQYTNEVE